MICVPTPLRKSKEPDISFILSAVENLLPRLRPGQLMVLESTTFPGTTEEVVQPRIESLGRVIGDDYFLAFSPERVDPGNKRFTTANIPKVVGGVTPACTELAAALYRHVTSSVFRASSPRVAETAKLLENTFRSVNIALANELAFACRKIGVDPWEVIDAAATKPFGFMPFYPGPGIGGHCIPVDPLYLSWKIRLTGYEAQFIALADQINRNMPEHVVTLVSDALNDRGKALRGSVGAGHGSHLQAGRQRHPRVPCAGDHRDARAQGRPGVVRRPVHARSSTLDGRQAHRGRADARDASPPPTAC